MKRPVRWTLLLAALLSASLVWPIPQALAGYPGDNGHIAFTRRRNIYTINPAGSGLHKLTDGQKYELDPTWSPDGRRILFIRNVDGPTQLWVMRRDGTGERRIVKVDGEIHGASWSPDGKVIVFSRVASRRRTQAPGNLWTVRPDGTHLRKLTQTPDRAERDPEWSPDGDRIAFVSFGRRGPDIWTMDAEGGNARQVTFGSAECRCRPKYSGFFDGYDYSPDGDAFVWAALLGEEGAFYGMWTIDEDGSDKRELLYEACCLKGPAFSPNGHKIVYSDRGRGSGTALYKMRLDGSHRTRITDYRGEQVLDLSADWGPS